MILPLLKNIWYSRKWPFFSFLSLSLLKKKKISYCCILLKHIYFTKIIGGKVSEIQGEISACCSYIYINNLCVPWSIPRHWGKLARSPASMLMTCQSPRELNTWNLSAGMPVIAKSHPGTLWEGAAAPGLNHSIKHFWNITSRCKWLWVACEKPELKHLTFWE